MINIAIDGPAGAGKSTIARKLADKLNLLYVDTGAMYRTVAVKAKRMGGIEKLKDEIDLNIRMEFIDGIQHMFLDGEDVTDLIRTPEISMGASDVGRMGGVREKLTRIQRDFAKENGVVMEGRDIGSHVLPGADFKLFLTASLEERARRRYEELLSKGTHVTLDDIKKDIEHRDKNDSLRKIAPLVKAQDAVVFDSTGMEADDVAEELSKIIKLRLEMLNGKDY